MFIYTENHAEFDFWNDSIELYEWNDVYIDFSKKSQISIFQKISKINFLNSRGGPGHPPRLILGAHLGPPINFLLIFIGSLANLVPGPGTYF